MNATTYFPASHDLAGKLTTALVIVIVGSSVVLLGVAGFRQPSAGMSALFGGIAIAMILLFVVLGAMVTLGYELTDAQVIVRRPIRSISVPFSRIADVRPIELHRVIRVFGVGGFFGAWGWFSSAELSWFRAYVTRRRGLVCLRLTDGAPIVLSPDRAAEFVAALRERLPPPRNITS